MTVERHLLLQQKVLAPSAEWVPASQGWMALRIAEGNGYWLRNGSPVRSVNAGDVLIFGPSGEGVLRASQLGPLRVHFFTVVPRLLSGVLTVGEGYQLEAAFKNIGRQFQAYPATEAIGLKFTALVAQGGDHLAVRCACLHLWAESMTGVLAENPAAGAGDNNLRHRFRELIGHIPEIELAAHSLAALAGQLHCSERHFSRLFREEFGISLRARQIELRLERARQLLANPNAKIISVAYESGYHHLGLFNAMFKKRFAVTPSEWRRQNLPRSTGAPVRVSLPHRLRRVGQPALALLMAVFVWGTLLVVRRIA